MLANERTFAGWLRTGMACLGVAIGLQAVFGEMSPTYVARASASVFVVSALIIFFISWRRATATLRRLNSHAAHPVSSRAMGWKASVLAVGATAVGAILWFV